MRMYDDKFSIWNEGTLPEGLSSNLERQHRPPRNTLIADVCFKGGYIDAWGRGTLKNHQRLPRSRVPEPQITEQDGGLLVHAF